MLRLRMAADPDPVEEPDPDQVGSACLKVWSKDLDTYHVRIVVQTPNEKSRHPFLKDAECLQIFTYWDRKVIGCKSFGRIRVLGPVLRW